MQILFLSDCVKFINGHECRASDLCMVVYMLSLQAMRLALPGGNQYFLLLTSLLLCFRSVFLNVPFMLIIYSLTCIVGLTVFAYYWELGCDPLRSGQISSSNQVSLKCEKLCNAATLGLGQVVLAYCY